MRHKLQKFESFVQTLLPHEVGYLLQVQQFQDADNLDILRRIHHNCHPLNQAVDFDTELDKRKYSNLKKWILTRLEAIDVDLSFHNLITLEEQIMTDAIMPETEQAFLQTLADYQGMSFYFSKLYEVARRFQQYLAIRMRFQDEGQVSAFLSVYEPAYTMAQEVQAQLDQATQDLTRQYSRYDTETRKWEPWLHQTFFDPRVEGHSRYLAVVRLTMLYINYREYDKLRTLYDALDEVFRTGAFYSRRLLVNYYANRLILHSKFGEWDEAIMYGYLSIRHQTTEYLQYITNLGAVLLRCDRAAEALDLMQGAVPEMRKTQNFHNKTGFAAFYIKSLYDNGRQKQALQYAESFLRSYQSRILAQRWHLFFSVYLQVLTHQQQYAKVLSLVRKHKLLEKEKEYRKRPAYLPTLHWYYLVARYQEGQINQEKLAAALAEDWEQVKLDMHKYGLLRELVEELYPHAPQVFAPYRREISL
ncbi:MAG: hypothetical protein D6722_18830 [Bacteroidetes bacterium]|nr:MAG: hypothetical protein D6722_18830 [Bacteroidota bacterium]